MEEKFEDVLAEVFLEVVVKAAHVHVVAVARCLRTVLDEADLFEFRKFSPVGFRRFTRAEMKRTLLSNLIKFVQQN